MKSYVFSRTAFTVGLALWVALPLFVGCGRSNKPTQANVAKESLQLALTSWKEGRAPADLKAQTPSIVMADTNWEKGAKLASFDFSGPESDDGVNLHVPVKLVLNDAQGNNRVEHVQYVVGTDPVITIFPEE